MHIYTSGLLSNGSLVVHGTFPGFRNIYASMMTKIASKGIYRNNQGHEKVYKISIIL